MVLLKRSRVRPSFLTEFDLIYSSGCAEQGHPAERKKRAPADARRYKFRE